MVACWILTLDKRNDGKNKNINKQIRWKLESDKQLDSLSLPRYNFNDFTPDARRRKELKT